MPHDKKGNLLAVGDVVELVGTVTAIQPQDDYCNASIELPPMPPYTDPYGLTLNTRQMLKQEPPPFVLGDTVRDKVTGFVGKAGAFCSYLHGKTRWMLEGMDASGRPVEWWYDWDRLEPMPPVVLTTVNPGSGAKGVTLTPDG